MRPSLWKGVEGEWGNNEGNGECKIRMEGLAWRRHSNDEKRHASCRRSRRRRATPRGARVPELALHADCAAACRAVGGGRRVQQLAGLQLAAQAHGRALRGRRRGRKRKGQGQGWARIERIANHRQGASRASRAPGRLVWLGPHLFRRHLGPGLVLLVVPGIHPLLQEASAAATVKNERVTGAASVHSAGMARRAHGSARGLAGHCEIARGSRHRAGISCLSNKELTP